MSEQQQYLTAPTPGWGSQTGDPVYIRFKNKKFSSRLVHWQGNSYVPCAAIDCGFCLEWDKPLVRYTCTVRHDFGEGMVEKIWDMPSHVYPDVLALSRSMKADEWRKTWFKVWRTGAGIHLHYNIAVYEEAV